MNGGGPAQTQAVLEGEVYKREGDQINGNLQ